MKIADYLIVGDGYAALFFAHRLIMENKSFYLFSENKQSASQVSAGIINPVVLKKFTTFWLAQEQIHDLQKTLSEMAEYTGRNYWINEPIHRIFHNIKERELWQKKANDETLSGFLSTAFVSFDTILNPFGTGMVDQSARLNVSLFFHDFFKFLSENDRLIPEQFDYNALNPVQNQYKTIEYKNIVFCEGMGVVENPFFKDIPLQPNKGHHLKVKISKPIRTKVTLKKKHFLFPLEDDLYYYGGTYDRNESHHDIDETAKDQLVKGLEEFYPEPFEVVDVQFGFRPTVKDRRPILGNHHEFKNLFVFNGLGARGILNGNYFAGELFQLIEHGKPLPEEVSLERFTQTK